MTLRLKERKEEEARRVDAALAALARARHAERHRRELIEDVFRGGAAAGGPALVIEIAMAWELCRDRGTREAFRRLVLHLEAHAEGLFEGQRGAGENSTVMGLLRLARQYRCWVRMPESWRPTVWSASRQFSQLARHLLAKYPVPAFMDSLFFTTVSDEMEGWFAHVGSGANIRFAPGLTVPLTKRMAHCFLEAPEEYDVYQALRWGQVLGLGGSARLARALNVTNLGRQTWPRRDEDWWLTVIQWFVNQPMLDLVHVGPIIDFVHYRRFIAEEPPGAFPMKGRSAAALLRLVEEWHRHVHHSRRRTASGFEPCGIRGGEWKTGKHGMVQVWRIQEILDTDSLEEEGRKMRHCVATYEGSIERGTCSIWSLQVDRYGTGPERAVTVELENARRRIVQVRGKCNRFANDEETAVLKLWAQENYLTLAF